MSDILQNRASGVLMHITSLPSPYGIGSLGEAAYRFVDFLEASEQRFWQILPIGTTGFADSPYHSFSVYAGNLYLIDLDLLVEDGLLQPGAPYQTDFGTDPVQVDYSKIYAHRTLMFNWAFKAYLYQHRDEWHEAILQFREENDHWIDDYALFMAIKTTENGKPWQQWPAGFRDRDPEALTEFAQSHKEQIEYQIFLQYIFFKQWRALKEYANSKGIAIIGDIPLYVAEDSVEFWASPELCLHEKVAGEAHRPKYVAGTPQDYYAEDGQLWGNPLFDWEHHAKDNYTWWIKRLQYNLNLFDYLRLDHFRGFDALWAIPYGAEHATDGEWLPGPRQKFFDVVEQELGLERIPLIAEDLSVRTDEVHELRERYNIPGMAVMQFAFSPQMDSPYLPHNLSADQIYYVSNHDNDTILGWCRNVMPIDLEIARVYLGLNDKEGYTWGLIRGAMSSVSKLSIVQMQDLLSHGSWARMNKPGTAEGNWRWRLRAEELTPELTRRFRSLTRATGRSTIFFS